MPVDRWKLACGVLTACLAYTWFGGDPATTTPSAQASRARRFDGPLRVNAAALGISTDELVRRIFAAKTVTEMNPLAEKLGAVGDDDTIDAVTKLLSDPRPGVPELMLGAFGTIGSDHAVDVILKYVDDPRSDVQYAAIDALGRTRNKRAEEALLRIASSPGNMQSTAVYALGELETDGAVAALADIASRPGDLSSSAMGALARIETPAAREAIAALVDAPSIDVAAAAMRSLEVIDDEMFAKLQDIINAQEPELAGPAVQALGKAGARAMPILKEMAFNSTGIVQTTAIASIGELNTPESVDLLKTLLEGDNSSAASAAADALATLDNDVAREALISAALGDNADESGAVASLMKMTGPEVEAALLEIAKQDPAGENSVLTHLMSTGNADATKLVLDLARNADTNESKLEALRMLAGAQSDAALDGALSIVRNASDEAFKRDALRTLAESKAGDPAVGLLLEESMRSSDPDVAVAAAQALSRFGTDGARDALVKGLNSADPELASASMNALSRYRLTDETATALNAAALQHPELKQQVMAQLITAGSPQGIAMAKAAIQSGDAEDMRVTIRALSQTQTAASFEVLTFGARSSNVDVRREAIDAIGYSGNAGAADIVMQAMRDSDSTVRYSAARALGGIGGDKARGVLIDMTRNGTADDKMTAISSLRRIGDEPSQARIREMFRDPDSQVAISAIENMASYTESHESLRAVVKDPRTPDDVRSTAKSYLRAYAGDSFEEDTAVYFEGRGE